MKLTDVVLLIRRLERGIGGKPEVSLSLNEFDSLVVTVWWPIDNYHLRKTLSYKQMDAIPNDDILIECFIHEANLMYKNTSKAKEDNADLH